MTCGCPHFDANRNARYILHREPCLKAGTVTDPSGKDVEPFRPPDSSPEITEFSRGD